jgi:hypothetical protein
VQVFFCVVSEKRKDEQWANWIEQRDVLLLFRWGDPRSAKRVRKRARSVPSMRMLGRSCGVRQCFSRLLHSLVALERRQSGDHVWNLRIPHAHVPDAPRGQPRELQASSCCIKKEATWLDTHGSNDTLLVMLVACRSILPDLPSVRIASKLSFEKSWSDPTRLIPPPPKHQGNKFLPSFVSIYGFRFAVMIS